MKQCNEHHRVRHDVNLSNWDIIIIKTGRATWLKVSKKVIENLRSQKKRK
jgi:hypothetical protein